MSNLRRGGSHDRAASVEDLHQVMDTTDVPPLRLLRSRRSFSSSFLNEPADEGDGDIVRLSPRNRLMRASMSGSLPMERNLSLSSYDEEASEGTNDAFNPSKSMPHLGPDSKMHLAEWYRSRGRDLGMAIPKDVQYLLWRGGSLLNPLGPHDALKHHFTSLKTHLIFLQLSVLE